MYQAGTLYSLGSWRQYTLQITLPSLPEKDRRGQQLYQDGHERIVQKADRVRITMIPNHAYLSLVIPPQDRIAIAVGLFCIAVVLGYFLVKALLYSAEQDSGI